MQTLIPSHHAHIIRFALSGNTQLSHMNNHQPYMANIPVEEGWCIALLGSWDLSEPWGWGPNEFLSLSSLGKIRVIHLENQNLWSFFLATKIFVSTLIQLIRIDTKCRKCENLVLGNPYEQMTTQSHVPASWHNAITFTIRVHLLTVNGSLSLCRPNFLQFLFLIYIRAPCFRCDFIMSSGNLDSFNLGLQYLTLCYCCCCSWCLKCLRKQAWQRLCCKNVCRCKMCSFRKNAS